MGEHTKYENIWRDEYMIDHSDPDTRYVGVPLYSIDVPVSRDQQVVAEYRQGKWHTEAQVQVDGEWWVANRNTLEKPDDADEWTHLGRVERSLGLFTNLSLPLRILFAPLYGLLVTLHCLMGRDVNYQLVDTDDR